MTLAIQKNFDYFLDESFKKYEDGEWVAIFDQKVIAHGGSLKMVMENAKKLAPLAKVLFSKVKKTASYL